MPKLIPISVQDLGDYLKEQRHSAQLSLRQLSAVAGISNPYLSQIERGLKKPSAEILQALAKALRISAESLYVRAGILDERTDQGDAGPADVREAILAEPKLNDRQRAVLLDVYESFVGEPAPRTARQAPRAPRAPRPSQPSKPSKPSQSSKPSQPSQPSTPSAAQKQPEPVVPTKEKTS
jgi:transcriptional regulator with XRE-family HTH domain